MPSRCYIYRLEARKWSLNWKYRFGNHFQVDNNEFAWKSRKQKKVESKIFGNLHLKGGVVEKGEQVIEIEKRWWHKNQHTDPYLVSFESLNHKVFIEHLL